MELRQLRHFLEVVDQASFCQAADKLHITQPALSKSIRNLELQLDVLLLERHPGGVQMTDYGRVLYQYAQSVTTELERAREEIDTMRGRGSGLVRIGAGVSLLKYLVPQAVKRFIDGQPGCRVEVKQGLKDRLLPMLRRGELDLVIGSVDPDTVPDDLRQKVLCEDQLTVVACQSHRLAGKAGVTAAELTNHKWVLPDKSSEPESDRLFRLFRKAGLEPPTTVVRTGSSIFMATLLRDSDYLSYVPSALLQADPEYAHLCALDTEPIWENVHLGVSYRRKGVLLPPVRAFMTALNETCQAQGEGVQTRLLTDA